MPCRSRRALLSLATAAAVLAAAAVPAVAGAGPSVVTGAVTGAGRHEATFHATAGDAALVWFQYGLTDGYGTSTSPVESGGGPVDGAAGDLAAGTTYHVRAVAWNGVDEPAFGDDVTFTTADGAPPILTTGAATAVTRTTATLNATVEAPFDTARYAFEYGPTDGYGDAGGKGEVEAGGAAAPSLELTGLTPGTTYHFHVFAENLDGWSAGDDATFTTALEPPSATAGAPREVTETAATVTGSIATAGWSTNWHVEYGPTTAYGKVTDTVTTTVDGPVSARLAGLAPGRAYHYRFVAQNVDGVRASADATLTTAGSAALPAQEPPPDPSTGDPPPATTPPPATPAVPQPGRRLAFARLPHRPAIRMTRAAALVRVRCDAPACTAAVDLYERAGAALKPIGAGRQTLPAAGGTAVVRVPLTARGRTLIAGTARPGGRALPVTVRLRPAAHAAVTETVFATRPVRLTSAR